MTIYVQTGDISGSYPFRISNEDDVNDYLLRVSTAGVLEALGLVTAGGSISGAALHLPAAGSAGLHADSAGNLGIGGTSATDAASPILATAAGALSARTATFYPKDSSSVALLVANDKGGTGNLVEFRDTPGGTVIFSIDGTIGTLKFGGGFLPENGTSATVSGRKDNWAVAADRFRVVVDAVTGAANQDVTGILAVSRGFFYLENGDAGTDTLTLKHENTNSSAANRLSLPNNADRVLVPHEAVLLNYCAVHSRWHIVG